MLSLEEHFLETLYGVGGIGNFMADGSAVLVDLVVVSTFVAFITVEMNLVILLLNVLEAKRFVPALGENIKRNLTSD